MKTTTVGKIQKNFARVLKEIKAGEEIIVTNRGKPVARIISLGPEGNIEWPDFFEQALDIKGKPPSEIVLEDREDRF
jgi:prevent-host-death family protein